MYGYTHQSRDAMLAVKSVMELQINKLIEYHTKIDATERQRVTMFFDSVERYVASLFVARMVDNNYLVRSIDAGLEIRFSAGGHATAITFMIPPALKWEVKKMIPQKTTGTPFVDTSLSTAAIVNPNLAPVAIPQESQSRPRPYRSLFEDVIDSPSAPLRLDTVEDVVNYVAQQDRREDAIKNAAFNIKGEDRGAPYDPMSITRDCFFGTWAQSEEELLSREAYDKAMKVVG